MYIRRVFLFAMLVHLFVQPAISQSPSGAITGKVYTAEGEPANQVTILLRKTSKGAISDENGSFQIRRVPPGDYTLEISLTGHQSLSRSITIHAGKVETVEFHLKLNRSELEQVTIRSSTSGLKVNEPSGTLRLKAPLLEIAQNIQVVTEKTLRDQQVTDMLEGVTRNVSGATRIDSWDNYANITMRGITLTAFRNGMNVKSPWGPLLEDMSVIERIEFVKGPAGFMLANGEPAGFYNVVTKKPTGVNRGEVTMTMGSFDQYRTTLDLDGLLSKDGKLLYRLNLMGQLKNAHRDFDFNNRYTIAPVLTYKINEQTSVTAEYTFQKMQMAMLGSAYVFSPKKYGELPARFSFLEPNLEPTNINDHSLFLSVDHQLQENWTLTTRLAYLNFKQTGSSMWLAYPVGLSPDGTATRSVANWDAFNEARLGQAYVNGEFRTGKVRHRVLGGLDIAYKNYYADFYQVFSLTGFTPAGAPVPFNIYAPVHGFIPPPDLPQFDRSVPLRQRGGGTLGERSSSIYIQDEAGFAGDRIRLTVAGRYTTLKQHSYGTYSEDKKFTPRAGVSVSLDKQSAVYALYDQAFVAQQGYDSALKPFVPITGNNIEAGFKKDWFAGKFNSTLSVYQLTRNNVITLVPGPQYKPIQTGQTRTRGIEIDMRGEIVTGLNMIWNYAFTRAKITRDADPAKLGEPVNDHGFAAHITNAWLNYRVPSGRIKGLGAALGYQYQGGRSDALPEYFRVDGSLSWHAPRYSVSINANNLLDKYLFMGSLYEHNNDVSSTEYNYQVEPGINFRMLFAYRF